MTIETKRINKIKLHGHTINFYTNLKGKLCIMHSRTLTSGKNKGQEKVIESWSFVSEEKREQYVRAIVQKLTEYKARKKSEAENLAAVKASLVNPFKVGQVMYDSWGYDQTNVDFYEIIEVKAKSVIIQEIGSSVVPSSGAGYSSMSAHVKPDPSHRGATFTKPIIVRIWDGKTTVYIKSKHGWISEYTAGETGVYSSWYA